MASDRGKKQTNVFHLICQGKYSFLYSVIVPVVYCAVRFCWRFSFLRRYFWKTKPALSHCSPVLIKASHSQNAARTKIRTQAVKCTTLRRRVKKMCSLVVCDRFYSAQIMQKNPFLFISTISPIARVYRKVASSF